MRVASMAIGLSRWMGNGRSRPSVTSWSIRKIICCARPTAKAGMSSTPPRAKVRCERRLQLVEHRDRGVGAVAVGALDHQVVGGGRRLGVVRQDGVEAAHVAAEEHARGARRPRSRVRSTEAAPSRWPASRKRKENTGESRALLVQGHRLEQRQALLHVGAVEERQRRLVPRQALAVEVVRVLFLQVGGVLRAAPRPARAWAACRRRARGSPACTRRGTRPMWSMWVCVSTRHRTDARVERRGVQLRWRSVARRPGTSRSPPAAASSPASTQVLRAGHGRAAPRKVSRAKVSGPDSILRSTVWQDAAVAVVVDLDRRVEAGDGGEGRPRLPSARSTSTVTSCRGVSSPARPAMLRSSRCP